MWKKITNYTEIRNLVNKKDYMVKYDVSGKILPNFENATKENIMAFIIINNNPDLEEVELGLIDNQYETYITIGLSGFVSQPLIKKYKDIVSDQFWWYSSLNTNQ